MERLPDGVFSASLTPLKNDLSIDFDKLVRHAIGLVENGCDGIVLMGTTGEANSFDLNERKAILEQVIEGGIAPHKILVGTGCCSISETVSLTQHAMDCGVNHVLVLPPFYYRAVDDDGLFRYFEELVNRVNNQLLRIYLYHFPKMTGLPFSHDLIQKMIDSFGSNIEGIKDSSGDWNNMSLMCSKFSDFRVFSGTEVYLRDLLKVGGAGTISASVNVTHTLAAEVYGAVDKPNGESLQNELTSIRRAIEKYPTIPVLKLIMSQLEGDDNWLNIRPPLMPLTLWNEDEIKNIIQQVRVQ